MTRAQSSSTQQSVFARPDRTTLVIGVVAGAVLIALLVVAGMFLASSEQRYEMTADDFQVPYAGTQQPTGVVHEIALTAAPGTIQTNGIAAEDVWSFNGVVPGPEIRIRLGDTVRVVVNNDLDVPTSVHWHGIRVPHSMDGVPGLTQDPIPPGGSFTYEFTPPDAGTYWYHSHKRGNEQLERGLYGSFVVEDPEPNAYTQDVVLMVDDWLLDDAGRLDTDFDSNFDLHHNGRWGTAITVNGMANGALKAAPGERLRLRMVNASNARIYQLRFGELDAVAVAMDGLYTAAPLDPAGLEISPGNRVDIDVTIPADASGSFVIADSFIGINPVPLISIEIDGDPVQSPSFDPPSGLVPDWSAAVDADPTVVFKLALVGEEASDAIGLAGADEPAFRWTINDRSWPDAATHSAKTGVVEKLRFVNESGVLHPMHLHGQFFQVIARNGVPVREGHFRDVVLLDGRDTVDVVVVPVDAGTWALHCHIQLHAEYGMATLYEVR